MHLKIRWIPLTTIVFLWRPIPLLLFCERTLLHILIFVSLSPTVAPLCFLYNEPSKLYSVFREMYIRYFFRLHSISSSPSVNTGSIVLFLWNYFQNVNLKYSVCVYNVCTLCMCGPAGDCVFVPAVWAAAPDPPASALLPPPTDRGSAVSCLHTLNSSYCLCGHVQLNDLKVIHPHT